MSSTAASLLKEVQAAIQSLEGLSAHRERLGDQAANGGVVAVELVTRRDLRGVHVVVDEHLVRDLQFEIFGPLSHRSTSSARLRAVTMDGS